MTESTAPRNPFITVLITLLVSFFSFQVAGSLIGFALAIPFYPGSLTEMIQSLTAPEGDPRMKIPMLIMQGFGSFFGLVLIPALMLRTWRQPLTQFFNKKIPLLPAILTFAILGAFMVVISVAIEWNQNITFPEFMAGAEKWMREMEDKLAETTAFMTHFDSFGQYLIGLLVIAVIPAFGEEIVFRGIIQNELYRGTKNIHVAIWVSAMIFSAFHVQFYGFVPRVLLGALFGYLYHWSGNLSLAVLAHFLNNGISVTALYFYQQGKIPIDIEKPEAAPWSAVLSAAVLTSVLLFGFKKYYSDLHRLSEK